MLSAQRARGRRCSELGTRLSRRSRRKRFRNLVRRERGAGELQERAARTPSTFRGFSESNSQLDSHARTYFTEKEWTLGLAVLSHPLKGLVTTGPVTAYVEVENFMALSVCICRRSH